MVSKMAVHTRTFMCPITVCWDWLIASVGEVGVASSIKKVTVAVCEGGRGWNSQNSVSEVNDERIRSWSWGRRGQMGGGIEGTGCSSSPFIYVFLAQLFETTIMVFLSQFVGFGSWFYYFPSHSFHHILFTSLLDQPFHILSLQIPYPAHSWNNETQTTKVRKEYTRRGRGLCTSPSSLIHSDPASQPVRNWKHPMTSLVWRALYSVRRRAREGEGERSSDALSIWLWVEWQNTWVSPRGLLRWCGREGGEKGKGEKIK